MSTLVLASTITKDAWIIKAVLATSEAAFASNRRLRLFFLKDFCQHSFANLVEAFSLPLFSTNYLMAEVILLLHPQEKLLEMSLSKLQELTKLFETNLV